MMLILLVVGAITATLAVASPTTNEDTTLEVTLQQGTIMGSYVEATNGRKYYTFRSIPYAKPPVGALRFKDPEPAAAWSGVRNGSIPMPKCPQISILDPSGTMSGQEDCLYINVYTPKLNSSLPVMVYIHGGGFIFGSAEDASPAPLLQKDVVVVTMNYRLGILGFLSTGDDVLPGNLGLKDQVLALRWVQDNIRDLGGDPQQVTIFGVSAGGRSVHLHILSPSSAGLFQRAIMQSGTALMSSYFPPLSEGERKISKALNCTGETSRQRLACLGEVDVKDLVTVLPTLYEWYFFPALVGISVDGTFLPDHPAAMHKAGLSNKVDVISGITQDDGNTFTTDLFTELGEKSLPQMKENFTKTGPMLLMMAGEEDPVYLARRVFFQYMTDLNVTKEKEFALTRLLGDYYFNAPNMQTMEFLAKDSSTKTFMYQLDHPPEKSLMYLVTNVTQGRKMVGHGDDMLYLFQFPSPIPSLSRPQDLHMQDILVNLWTNFASTGNPTINGTLGFRWTPLVPEGPLHYLSLSTTPTMQPVDGKNREFWNTLPTKVNKLLYPEYFREDWYASP